MRRGFFLLRLFLIILAIVTASCLAYSFSVNSTVTENYLIMILERKIYQPGDEMRVTFRNLSDESIDFPHEKFGLEFEKWSGTAWVEYLGIGRAAVFSSIDPHTEILLVLKLTRGKEDFSPGRYRLITEAGLSERGEIIQASAEFEVQEQTIWVQIVIGAIVVAGIITAYLAIKRMRG
jgi:hypothetical protein